MSITDLDLDFLKGYMKIDHTEDDTLLSTMIVAARSFIQNYLNRRFADMIIEDGEVPEEFTIAGLAVIAHWYENRRIQGTKETSEELSYVFAGLLDQHRRWNSETLEG